MSSLTVQQRQARSHPIPRRRLMALRYISMSSEPEPEMTPAFSDCGLVELRILNEQHHDPTLRKSILTLR